MTRMPSTEADEHIYQVVDGDLSYRMWLPNAGNDHIQSSIARSGSPYEVDLLHAVGPWLSPGALIVDAGSNIGNHTVYWARSGHFVHAFEPDEQLAAIATRNVKLNRLGRRVTLHTTALGERDARGNIHNDQPENAGANRIELAEDGDVEVRPLDHFELRGVALLKVDVEGMELDVLKGASALLEADRPILVLESLDAESLNSLLELLLPASYAHVGTFNDSPTHIFAPIERLDQQQLVERTAVAARLIVDTADERRSSRARLDEVNLKYRSAMQQLASERERFNAREAAASTTRSQDLARISADLDEYRSRTDRLTSELVDARRQARAMSSELAASREHNTQLTRQIAESPIVEELQLRLTESATERAGLANLLVGERELNSGLRHELANLEMVQARLRAAAADLESLRSARRKDKAEFEGRLRQTRTTLAREAAHRAKIAADRFAAELQQVRQEAEFAAQAIRADADARIGQAGALHARNLAILGEEHANQLAIAQTNAEQALAAVNAAHQARQSRSERKFAILLQAKLSVEKAMRDEHDSTLALLAEARNETTQLIAEVQAAGNQAKRVDERLSAAEEQKVELERALRDERAANAATVRINERQASDLGRMGHRLADLESKVASLHAEKIRMADRLAKIGREREEFRSRLSAVRSSLTYRTGAIVREEIRRPLGMFRIPMRLVALRRSTKSHIATLARAKEPANRAKAAGARTVVNSVDPRGLAPQFVPPPRLDSPADWLVRRDRSDVKVACILDEFSFACFAPEGQFTQLSPTHWESELADARPDLLLIESAWRGADGAWHNSVARCGPEIMGILQWCKENAVPTAFWNKEDPVHFSTFLNLAAHFDAVFTTDADCVPRYRELLGHDRVYLLSFAAQPRVHNPIEIFKRQDAFAFAGAYYARYPERTTDLESFHRSLPSIAPLVIFDRMHGQSDVNYQFPERFKKHIAGRLEPDEIDIAYKGYSIGINLNSVKQSQSMFARRVYELVASNTLVLSNFSPALRVFFGDLLICTDSGAAAVTRLNEIRSVPFGERRMRAQALRVVLREHTYHDRLATICEKLGVSRAPDQVNVAVIAVANSDDEARTILGAVARQVHRPQLVVLVSANESRVADKSIRAMHRSDIGSKTIAEIGAGCTHVAVFDPAHYYGAHYLEDLALATRYADVSVVSKADSFRWDRALRHAERQEYVASNSAPASHAMLSVRDLGQARAAALLARDARVQAQRCLVIDGFEVVRNGAHSDPDAVAESSSAVFREGLSLVRIAATSERETSAVGHHEAPQITISDFYELFGAAAGAVDVGLEGDHIHVSSRLVEGKHEYVYARSRLALTEIGWGSEGVFFVDSSAGLNLQIAILFYDGDGARLGHSIAPTNSNHRFAIPDGTREVSFGLRASGPGRSRLRRIFLGEHRESAVGVMTDSEHLVLTNIYPSYDDLYRNGFVHSRVTAYREAGLLVEVTRLAAVPRPRSREFEGVRVTDLSPADLVEMIRNNSIKSVLVHFLDAQMWNVLRDPSLGPRVHIWVHGSEVQPWWRRDFNTASEDELAKAKSASAVRMSFWRSVFTDVPPHVDFVFVSDYFAEEVFEDVGIRLSSDRYRVIHNPIDGELFSYDAKPDDQRFKVLTIRPYASRKYANDLSVAAVLALRHKPIFDQLEFRFVGDGPMFEQTVAPLRELPNVTCDRRFLNHAQIAALHKKYGIFLTPTRMDAQGVSRDEAMSSGLVPITSAVAAVPEFVDESCGILAPAEDHEALAAGIVRLATDPTAFRNMSRAAARRVREQSGKSIVLAAELELIRGCRDE